MWHCYILRCSDQSYYTGITKDLENRLTCHNAGKGAKYTRSRRPVQLLYHETFETQKEAMMRENKIKTLTRDQKAALVQKRS